MIVVIHRKLIVLMQKHLVIDMKWLLHGYKYRELAHGIK